jgi:hypothetical protein
VFSEVRVLGEIFVIETKDVLELSFFLTLSLTSKRSGKLGNKRLGSLIGRELQHLWLLYYIE